jgi:hypothetical protein
MPIQVGLLGLHESQHAASSFIATFDPDGYKLVHLQYLGVAMTRKCLSLRVLLVEGPQFGHSCYHHSRAHSSV